MKDGKKESRKESRGKSQVTSLSAFNRQSGLNEKPPKKQRMNPKEPVAARRGPKSQPSRGPPRIKKETLDHASFET